MKETTITADDLAGDGIEAVRAGKAPYARMRAQGKTLAYADDRKEGVVLKLQHFDMKKAPKLMRQKVQVTPREIRMLVTVKNVKGARALLKWMAKQV